LRVLDTFFLPFSTYIGGAPYFDRPVARQIKTEGYVRKRGSWVSVGLSGCLSVNHESFPITAVARTLTTLNS